MKRIIDGRTYDTDTARRVGGTDNGVAYGDLDYEMETLYRKRTGEYFIHGEGGARTRYATQDCLGGWTGGDAVTPLPYETARRCAESNLDADMYESEFGVPDEGGEPVQVLAKVSPAARARLDAECSRTGQARSAIVESLLMGLGNE